MNQKAIMVIQNGNIYPGQGWWGHLSIRRAVRGLALSNETTHLPLYHSFTSTIPRVIYCPSVCPRFPILRWASRLLLDLNAPAPISRDLTRRLTTRVADIETTLHTSMLCLAGRMEKWGRKKKNKNNEFSIPWKEKFSFFFYMFGKIDKIIIFFFFLFCVW